VLFFVPSRHSQFVSAADATLQPPSRCFSGLYFVALSLPLDLMLIVAADRGDRRPQGAEPRLMRVLDYSFATPVRALSLKDPGDAGALAFPVRSDRRRLTN
jgi:hypothetical protein